jgi:hypothetical protein
MSRAAEFNRALDHLYRQRTRWLRQILGRRERGPHPKLGRTKIDNTIRVLQQLASEALANRLAKSEFTRSVAHKKSWHVKGWGWREKQRSFNHWFDRYIQYRSCVYVIWKSKNCVYVGKTRMGSGRPSSHFEKHWFHGATRIDIYALRGKRPLPSLECLAIHRFQPAENRQRAQSLKWTTACPLCKVHKDIQSELRAIFRLKS